MCWRGDPAGVRGVRVRGGRPRNVLMTQTIQGQLSVVLRWAVVPSLPRRHAKEHLITCKAPVGFGGRLAPPLRRPPAEIQDGEDFDLCQDVTFASEMGAIGNPIKRKCHAGNCVSQCESSVQGLYWGGGVTCGAGASPPALFLLYPIFCPL